MTQLEEELEEEQSNSELMSERLRKNALQVQPAATAPVRSDGPADTAVTVAGSGADGDSGGPAAGGENLGPESRGCPGPVGEAEQGAEDPPDGSGGSGEGQTQAQRRRPGGQN